jgi:predicted nucleic acid-binding protein
MKKSRVAIDASCLIAIQADEPLNEKFQNLLKSKWNGYCTEMAILETFYILCRKLQWKIAKTKINALQESNVIKIKPINTLLEIAAQLKCQRSIAIADCLTIALAESIKGKAIFYHKERELEKTMENELFNVEIIFFDEFNKGRIS